MDNYFKTDNSATARIEIVPQLQSTLGVKADNPKMETALTISVVPSGVKMKVNPTIMEVLDHDALEAELSSFFTSMGFDLSKAAQEQEVYFCGFTADSDAEEVLFYHIADGFFERDDELGLTMLAVTALMEGRVGG